MEILLLLLLPFVYAVMGGFLIADRNRTTLLLAPLAGCLLTGLVLEACLMTGLPPRPALLALAGWSSWVLWKHRKQLPHYGREALEYGALYLLLLAVLSLLPFPGALMFWSMDWWKGIQQGRQLWLDQLDWQLLAERPPVNGLSFQLAAFFLPELPAFQAYSAVVAAALAPAMRYAVWSSTGRRVNWPVLLTFLLSPFVLAHAATLWAKLLSGGAVLLAVTEAWCWAKRAETPVPWRSAWWLAAAVAVHHSSILFLPLIASTLLLSPAARSPTACIRLAGAFLAAGVALNAPYLLWLRLHLSASDIVASNPAMTFRAADSWLGLLWTNTVSALVGWLPAKLTAWRQLVADGALSPARAHYATLCGTFLTLAGTLLGTFLLPCLAIGRLWRRGIEQFPAPNGRRLGWLAAGNLLFLLLVHGLITPYGAFHGLTQAGLVPAILIGFVPVLFLVSDDTRPGRLALRLLLAAQGLVGLVFFACLCLGVWAGIHHPQTAIWPVQEVFVGSPDWRVFQQEQMTVLAGRYSLGLPAGLLVAASLILWRLGQREDPCSQVES